MTQLSARRDDLRYLALRAGLGAQAGRFSQWGAVEGLGAAGGFRPRRKLAGSNDGDRQMVKILAAVLSDGLPAVEADQFRRPGSIHSADVVLDVLARQRDRGPSAPIHTPASLGCVMRGRRLRPIR